jgi:hypothetical protein
VEYFFSFFSIFYFLQQIFDIWLHCFFLGQKFTILQQKKRVVKAPHDLKGADPKKIHQDVTNFFPNSPYLAYPCDLSPIHKGF